MGRNRVNTDLTQKNTLIGDVFPTIDLMKIKNLNTIVKMKQFEDDWNGVGGKAFSASAIDLFIKVIESLDIQPKIAPTGRNSLLMQYEMNDESFLAFEVCTDKVESVFIPKGNYLLARQEIYKSDFLHNIKERVKLFYEKG